jgi:signal transduction histidine kinase
VNIIERQNKRLQNLIDQVLNNSLGYQEIELKKEQVNSSDYLNTILDDFMLSTNEKNIKVNKAIELTDKKVAIDKFFFTTALFNVLENAVKYSHDAVEIDFSSSVNNTFKVSIQDSGIGIAIKDQKLLFDKFFRAGDKEIHNVKGLGLGLYYTNQIVKAHGGSIEVKSIEEKGTTFTIEIPVA